MRSTADIPPSDRLEALERRVARLEAATLPTDEPEYDVRDGVTTEQAADEIIRLLEASPSPLRPSELGQILRLDMTTVLDGIDLLKERQWVADADE